MLLSKLKESHPRDTEAGDDESDEIIHDLANVRFEISLCYDGAPVSRNDPDLLDLQGEHFRIDRAVQ